MTTISLPIIPKITGLILYEGKSLLNPNREIVVIATGFLTKSKNVKTGSMIQTYILNASDSPSETYKNGDDEIICGDCKHRSKHSGGNGTCYVNVSQGPQSVYNAYLRGSYTKANPMLISSLFKDKLVRFGSYGDPAAVSLTVWNAILSVAKNNTGYTHQWKKSNVQPYRHFLMASVDNVQEFRMARKMGWRTFRVRKSANNKLQKYEFECPASNEQGKRKTCETCMACNGGDSKANVAIIVHGIKYKVSKFIKG